MESRKIRLRRVVGARANAKSITLGVNGVLYELDLNESEACRLRSLLAPYIAHGRPCDTQAVPGD